VNFDDPLSNQRDTGDFHATLQRRQRVLKKPFVKRIYQEWYDMIALYIPPGLADAPLLELGSGTGFMKENIKGLVTSDIAPYPDINIVLDGQKLPFLKDALKGIVMVNVLHHFPRPRAFFAEAARCVRSGGSIIMIEPWVTTWSRFVYRRLHHEPFYPDAKEWERASDGPFSGSNSALPWIIFKRDPPQFVKEFTEWRINAIIPMMPFRYLVSGGVRIRASMPNFTFGMWKMIERCVDNLVDKLAMFALISLTKN
jgi:SAM-dependent methyltransferase